MVMPLRYADLKRPLNAIQNLMKSWEYFRLLLGAFDTISVPAMSAKVREPLPSTWARSHNCQASPPLVTFIVCNTLRTCECHVPGTAALRNGKALQSSRLPESPPPPPQISTHSTRGKQSPLGSQMWTQGVHCDDFCVGSRVVDQSL